MSDWFYNNNNSNAKNAYDLMANKRRDNWNNFDSSAFNNYVEKCTYNSVNKPLNSMKCGTTLLHAAVEFNNAHAVRILMNNSADVSVLDTFDNTPLDLAIKNNNKELVEILTTSKTNTDTEKLSTEISNLKEDVSRYKNLYDTETKKRQRCDENTCLFRRSNVLLTTEISDLKKDVSYYKDLHDTECKKRKRCESDIYSIKQENNTLQYNDSSLRKSLVSTQKENYNLTQENKSLKTENSLLHKDKSVLERDCKLLKIDNATLITENKKITKDRNTFKNRYEILKESTKK